MVYRAVGRDAGARLAGQLALVEGRHFVDHVIPYSHVRWVVRIPLGHRDSTYLPSSQQPHQAKWRSQTGFSGGKPKLFRLLP